MGFIKIPVKGMNDFMPSEMKLREYIIREIKDTYTKFGFNIIETPCLEHIENLCSKQGGENEKLIFKVLKRGEKLDYTNVKEENDLVDMGLRYDLTVHYQDIILIIWLNYQVHLSLYKSVMFGVPNVHKEVALDNSFNVILIS